MSDQKTRTFTLDDIREATEAKYGATVIDLGDSQVKLLNPLRLPKTKRDDLQAAQSRMEEDGADQYEILSDCIGLIAETKPQAKALLGKVNGDLAMLATIFESYTEGTQAGEASASQD